MAYEYITKYDALRFTKGRQGQKIKEIVIHHWGKDGQTFDGVINWFVFNKNGQGSAHFVVEAGKVAYLVNLYDTGWHAGNWYRNITSVGIECRPEMSRGDLETTAELISNIWKNIGYVVPLVGHKDIVPTYCPGRYYNNLTYLYNLAMKYYKGEESAPKQQPQRKSIVQIAKEVWAGLWGTGQERVNKLANAGYNPSEVQAEVNKGRNANIEQPKPKAKDVQQLADEVINGYWGVGENRKARLKEAGYSYEAVQAEVNRLLGAKQSKSISQLADEVIAGKWGVDPQRSKNLRASGYDAVAVQAEVNRRFS